MQTINQFLADTQKHRKLGYLDQVEYAIGEIARRGAEEAFAHLCTPGFEFAHFYLTYTPSTDQEWATLHIIRDGEQPADGDAYVSNERIPTNRSKDGLHLLFQEQLRRLPIIPAKWNA